MTGDSAQIEPALAGHTGYLLYRAFARAAACGTDAMPPGRHPRELAILAALVETGPLSQARLGELLDINRTIMVKIVDGLETDGLVDRERDPADRRRYALRPTAAGTVELAELQQAADEAEGVIAAGLSPAERVLLRALLSELVPDLIRVLPASITGRIGFLVARSHHRLRERGDRLLRGLGIEPRHFGMLTMLAALQPCSQQRLAERMGVTGPSLVQTIDDLDRSGLVDRERNPADRRELLLRLTPLGRDRLAGATAAMQTLQDSLAEQLGPGRVAELNALLTTVVTAPLPRAEQAGRS